MLRPSSWRLLLLTAGLLQATAPDLAAQSLVSGSVQGVVRSADGVPISSASVVVRSTVRAFVRFENTDRRGRFAIPFVLPGSYEVLVEALGYRPVLLRSVTLPVGDVVRLDLALESAQGPVTNVDTVPATSARADRWTAGGVRVRPDVVDASPRLFEDLSAVAELASSADGSMGVEGLPGYMSSLFIDGVPFTPARHPSLSGEGIGSPVLAGTATAWLTALTTPADVEWGGGGAVLSATSRSGTASGEPVELAGSWSGDALWTSSELDVETPGLTSFWASGAAEADLVPDTAGLFLAVDGMRTQLPAAPRIGEDAAALLAGVDPGLVAAFSAPSVEETTRISGLSRLEWSFGAERRLSLRAAVGHMERTFEGPGIPALRYGATPAGTATDFSVAAGLTNQQSEVLALEFRGGFSGSSREFTGDGVAGALVAGSGLMLGTPAGTVGSASRLDFTFSSTAHYSFDGGTTLKGGGQVRTARHTMTHSAFSGGRYLFPAATDLPDGPAAVAHSAPLDVTFSTPEIGVFAQFAWAPDPDIRVTVGGRVDYESLPRDAEFDPTLEEVSGLDNSAQPKRFISPGAGVSVQWNLTGDEGRAVFLGAASLQNGDIDPAFLGELFVRDGDQSTSRFFGADTGWPAGGGPGGATTLPGMTLFGPDMRPPRHIRISAGLLTRLGPSTSLYAGGSYRRTDFLARRRNLNLGVSPLARDQNGRGIWGELRKDGALLTADGRSHRRFAGFDDIWALDPDGWSTYGSATVGVEHAAGPVDLFAAYTRSTTEDNWLGAAGGHPDATQPSPVPDTTTAWAEGTSDFDIPDRVVAGATVGAGTFASVSAVYRYASGRPFTPGYRGGVDANADGSGFNDPAFVPSGAELAQVAGSWPCLQDLAESFAARNACRGPGQHALDVRIQFRLTAVGGRALSVVVDGLNLIESSDGIRDTALLLVDPAAPLAVSADGSRVDVPVTVNPGFGRVLIPSSPGRILRLGVRLGG